MYTHYGDKVTNLTIAYIGGGSRGWAWGFMRDIISDPQISGTVRLYDIDHDAAERNQIIGSKLAAHPDAASTWCFSVSDTLQDALTGADFVIISILPGTFQHMQGDVHLPERLGIYQSVGDTVGAGGFMRAMRTLPMFVEIAQAIRDYAPDAFVINYTNPMTLCVRTLYEVYPNIKAFGCCHEVFGTQALLCKILEVQEHIPDVKRQELYTTVTGINHFTWLTSASYQGMDLMPVYDRFVREHPDGFQTGSDNWMNNHFACSHKVKFDLFRRYGAIAAAGDRHLVEFLPQWYLHSPDTAHSWGFGLTPVSWRLEDLAKRMQRSDDLLSGKEAPTLTASGEEGHLLLKALLGLGNFVSNVNIPNQGQIPNLPLGAVVETNALFSFGRIDPICAGAMPANILPLVSRHVYNQENTLQAALHCDRALGFATFMNDPQLGGVTMEDGQQLFDDMLLHQKDILPKGWFE